MSSATRTPQIIFTLTLIDVIKPKMSDAVSRAPLLAFATVMTLRRLGSRTRRVEGRTVLDTIHTGLRLLRAAYIENTIIIRFNGAFQSLYKTANCEMSKLIFDSADKLFVPRMNTRFFSSQIIVYACDQLFKSLTNRRRKRLNNLINS